MQYCYKKEFLGYIIHKEYYDFLKQELNKYYQHGKTTTYKHSRDVAYNSYKIAHFFNRRIRNSIDVDILVQSAYMHDLFMYDWHEKSDSHKWHGFTHPKVAAENALKYCNATPKMQKIIKTHMWPFTITKIPTSREGWILTTCDKFTALAETIKRV